MIPEQIAVISGASDADGNQQQSGYMVSIPSWGVPEVRIPGGEDGINIYENATGTPAELNVTATWSLDAAYQHGKVEGKEAKFFNMAIALYPRVNILRDPVATTQYQRRELY